MGMLCTVMQLLTLVVFSTAKPVHLIAAGSSVNSTGTVSQSYTRLRMPR